MGVLMSSNFVRPPNDQTDFLKDPKLSTQKFQTEKKFREMEISDIPKQGFSVWIYWFSKLLIRQNIFWDTKKSRLL